MELPLFLHAGETRSIKNRNLFDAVLLDNKRIGHGLNLVLFPELINEVKEKDILVEISPISNQTLGYVNDMRNHPGRILLSNGVQCSISSDDPSVFGYEGLSYDFWLVLTAWELDLRAIKKLVYNSILYSSLTGITKEISLKSLDRDWDRFIDQALELLEER